MRVLVEELEKFGRVVRAATTEAEVRDAMRAGVDFAAMGAGIPDDKRAEMTALVASINPDVPVHRVERTPQSHPRNMIAFINEKIIDHKLSKAMPGRPNKAP